MSVILSLTLWETAILKRARLAHIHTQTERHFLCLDSPMIANGVNCICVYVNHTK